MLRKIRLNTFAIHLLHASILHVFANYCPVFNNAGRPVDYVKCHQLKKNEKPIGCASIFLYQKHSRNLTSEWLTAGSFCMTERLKRALLSYTIGKKGLLALFGQGKNFYTEACSKGACIFDKTNTLVEQFMLEFPPQIDERIFARIYGSSHWFSQPLAFCCCEVKLSKNGSYCHQPSPHTYGFIESDTFLTKSLRTHHFFKTFSCGADEPCQFGCRTSRKCTSATECRDERQCIFKDMSKFILAISAGIYRPLMELCDNAYCGSCSHSINKKYCRSGETMFCCCVPQSGHLGCRPPVPLQVHSLMSQSKFECLRSERYEVSLKPSLSPCPVTTRCCASEHYSKPIKDSGMVMVFSCESKKCEKGCQNSPDSRRCTCDTSGCIPDPEAFTCGESSDRNVLKSTYCSLTDSCVRLWPNYDFQDVIIDTCLPRAEVARLASAGSPKDSACFRFMDTKGLWNLLCSCNDPFDDCNSYFDYPGIKMELPVTPRPPAESTVITATGLPVNQAASYPRQPSKTTMIPATRPAVKQTTFSSPRPPAKSTVIPETRPAVKHTTVSSPRQSSKTTMIPATRPAVKHTTVSSTSPSSSSAIAPENVNTASKYFCINLIFYVIILQFYQIFSNFFSNLKYSITVWSIVLII